MSQEGKEEEGRKKGEKGRGSEGERERDTETDRQKEGSTDTKYFCSSHHYPYFVFSLRQAISNISLKLLKNEHD